MMDNAASLILRESNVDPFDLRDLANSAEHLTELDLTGLPITDADLGYVTRLKSLQRLVLTRTNITLGRLKDLKSSLPSGCEIVQ